MITKLCHRAYWSKKWNARILCRLEDGHFLECGGNGEPLTCPDHIAEMIGELLYAWAKQQDVLISICKAKTDNTIYQAPEFRT